MNSDQINNLLKKYKLHPKKGYGQNFLINEDVLQGIVEAAELSSEDCVLEIGPGLGVLSKELAKNAKKVLAVEADPDMYEIAEKETSDLANVKIVGADILRYNFENLSEEFECQPYKVVANLPYNITLKFLKLILEQQYHPWKMVLMLQKEVAERICAKPGKMSKIAVLVQYFSQPEYLFTVPSSNFFPEPKVDSAVVGFSDISHQKYSDLDYKKFWQLVRAGFSSRRKKLLNNLRNVYEKDKIKSAFEKMNFSSDVRAQDLSVDDWVRLLSFL